MLQPPVSIERYVFAYRALLLTRNHDVIQDLKKTLRYPTLPWSHVVTEANELEL